MAMYEIFEYDMENSKNPTNLWSGEANKIERSLSSLLGPYGLYKMTENGNILDTGKDVLDNIELGPMSEPIIESINKQYKEFGDGTISLALLLSRLLIKADELVEHGVKMPNVISGYKKAMDIALDAVKDETETLRSSDNEALEKVIQHSVAGTLADNDNIILSMKDAVQFLKEVKDDNILVQVDDEGEGSEVITGAKLDYNRKRDDMPDEIYDVNIALMETIAPRKTQTSMEIKIANMDTYRATSDMEMAQLRNAIDKLAELDVRAVFVKESIDDRAAEMMVKAGIAGFEKVNEGDLKLLSDLTGAQVAIMGLISRDDIGYTGILDDRLSGECVGGVCRT
jgi:chaperonin GroEL (HSP60 family)